MNVCINVCDYIYIKICAIVHIFKYVYKHIIYKHNIYTHIHRHTHDNIFTLILRHLYKKKKSKIEH